MSKKKVTSLIQDGRYCVVCGAENALHLHHIFGGYANRQISDVDGCYCYLCYMHHNGGNYGVHSNRELDLYLKKECQTAWENKLGTREDFIKRYGKSWL